MVYTWYFTRKRFYCRYVEDSSFPVNFCATFSEILFSWFNDGPVDDDGLVVNDGPVDETLTQTASWNLHSQLPERAQNISLSLHPDVLGPFGIDAKNSEVGSGTNKHADKQPVFNSFDWLRRSDLTFNGIIFYYSEYIYGIRFLGINVKSDEDGTKISQGALNFKYFYKKYLKQNKGF